jgi:hypothetical protein
MLQPAYIFSRKGGQSVLIVIKTWWKNNLNFVKDVPMIYINCTVTVIIASGGKNRRHYFRTVPRIWSVWKKFL